MAVFGMERFLKLKTYIITFEVDLNFYLSFLKIVKIYILVSFMVVFKLTPRDQQHSNLYLNGVLLQQIV